jgi:hypothetical protein
MLGLKIDDAHPAAECRVKNKTKRFLAPQAEPGLSEVERPQLLLLERSALEAFLIITVLRSDNSNPMSL